jgi:hypothetical protein
MYLVDSEAKYGFENENEVCTYLLENVARYEFANGIKSGLQTVAKNGLENVMQSVQNVIVKRAFNLARSD